MRRGRRIPRGKISIVCPLSGFCITRCCDLPRMFLCRSCVVACCVLALSAISSSSQPRKYKYFDEYLFHLEKREQSILVQQIEIKVSGPPSFLRTGRVRSKEEQCCTVGQMAGEKGYHCFSQFYATRIIHRNYNRAHNKRIPNLLLKGGRRDPTADKLMRTFGQCVANRGAIFHKCCRHVSIRGA